MLLYDHTVFFTGWQEISEAAITKKILISNNGVGDLPVSKILNKKLFILNYSWRFKNATSVDNLLQCS